MTSPAMMNAQTSQITVSVRRFTSIYPHGGAHGTPATLGIAQNLL